MRDLIMQLNCHFSDDEKEKCISTINKILELANTARRQGILALEKEAVQDPSLFLKTALLLVVDGTDPVLIKQILQNLILADGHSGSQLLDRLLMAEGVLALQQGENPRIMSIKLCAMLGEKYIPRANEINIRADEKSTKYFDFLRKLRGREPLPESEAFQTKLLEMDNRSIQLVIRNVDNNYLVSALHGCGISLIYKIMDNVSLNTCLQICERWEILKNIHSEHILRAQREVLKVIETLENGGEIINIKGLMQK